MISYALLIQTILLFCYYYFAAFDTVDHSILLSRLEQRFGVKGKVIQWIKSYLMDREQFVQIENCKSTLRKLVHGVLQGSVFGRLLYVLYTSPIADITKNCDLQYHLYADDT